MMNVLYQAPHGYSTDEAAADRRASERHCIHTVRSADTVLLTAVRFSECFDDQASSLKEAVSSSVAQDDLSRQDVELIYSDAPNKLDKDELFTIFEKLLCVGKDPIHVALKVEKAFGERKSKLSVRLRACMRKFAHGHDDFQLYFKHDCAVPRVPKLHEVAGPMTQSTAIRRARALDQPDYATTPYRRPLDFVKDVAALTIVHASLMRRRTGKTSTVRSSLAFASSGK